MRIAPARMPDVAVRTQGAAPESSLTPREEEVLRLLTFGKSNKEIATALDIGERTAKLHVKNLLQKFKVSTRTELISRWFKNGSALLAFTYSLLDYLS